MAFGEVASSRQFPLALQAQTLRIGVAASRAQQTGTAVNVSEVTTATV